MIKNYRMNILVLILLSFHFHNVYPQKSCIVNENLCSNQVDLSALDHCKIKADTFELRECTQISFFGNDKVNENLGSLKLKASIDKRSHLTLNISFLDIKWKKAYLKLTNYKNQITCKMYTVDSQISLPVTSLVYDPCLLNLSNYESKDYLLEFKGENKIDIQYKKILFQPPLHSFDKNIPLRTTPIFSYIDWTNNYEIVLKVQTLPAFYNVTYYKVEVYREKDNNIILLDMRLLPAGPDELVFEYVTFNEEGYYYFKVSAISDKCPEDSCEKTVTPKVYISSKGTPLVIGIVGASFIIPFVLFLFHLLTRRYKNQEGLSESNEKILLIYKSSTDKHNDVIRTLVKTIENLVNVEVMLEPVNLAKTKQKDSEKWCSDNLLLATHIFYICGLDNFELDYMTYNFLLEETKKTIPEKDIFILMFPYSIRDLPAFLANCVTFEFMADFHKFVSIFRANVEYATDANYLELKDKIKIAQTETESVTTTLEMPKIIITEQSDSSDSDPKEADGLL